MALFGRKKQAAAETEPAVEGQQQRQPQQEQQEHKQQAEHHHGDEGDFVMAPGAEDISQFAVPDENGEGQNDITLKNTQTNGTTATQDIEYPSGLKLVLLMASIFIAMFLVALDRLIIATAIPQITDQFHSQEDIGWYGSAYLLATCSFQLIFGKMYTFYSIKTVFLCAIGLFEVGSAVCGAAPSSIAFIIGRALAGWGAAGLFSGVIVILTYAVPLHKRPMYQGLFGAVFGLASVAGPLLGGAFTTNVTWRWCFYINLPLGGVAMTFIAFLLHIPDRKTTKLPTKKKLAQLDAVGTTLFIPGVVCLLLALQWGGLTYEWSNGRIIALLVLAAILLIGFVLVQILMPDTATVPPRIFSQRSIMAGFYMTFCIGSEMMIFVYFLPIWFQSIEGVSAVESGIRTLPLVLAMVAASIMTGVLTSKVGYYTPFMIVGTCLMSVGAGLITTFDLSTTQPQWVGYQFLYGFGMGMTFQGPNLAAQTVLPNRDVPIGTSLMFFSQLLGGAIFISVGQNVLDNRLITELADVPGFSPEFIKNSGATQLTDLSPALRAIVLPAYNKALQEVFIVGLALSCAIIFGALAMEWRSVKNNIQKPVPEPEEGTASPGADAASATAAGKEVPNGGEEDDDDDDDDNDTATEQQGVEDHEVKELEADSSTSAPPSREEDAEGRAEAARL